ncbi:hypothetical protein PFISCL1PPCAC_16338, partial [Pristionchus fissidentatus]
ILLLFLPVGFGFTHHQILRDASINQPFFSLSPSQLTNSIEGAVSNYPPVLEVKSGIGYLDENAIIGTTVRVSPLSHSPSLQITVTDADLKAGMPPATYQYVLTGLGATVFAVDQRGFVYLNVNEIDSDPPNPQTYQLTVQAREVDTVPIRSSAPITITINIVDANDNSPQFETPIVTAETTAGGGERSIVKVEATDKDDGLYGTISYAITQVDGLPDTHLFFYDQPSHTLMTKEDLEPGRSYQVVVTATDGGGLSAQSIIIVAVFADTVPATSSSPIVSLSSHQSTTAEETIQTIVTDIKESATVNTLVVQLGEERPMFDVLYSIEGGNEDGNFAIDASTGAIRTLKPLDARVSSLYSLQVETRSTTANQHLYWTLVQISVTTSPNTRAPVFMGTQPLLVALAIDDLAQLKRDAIVGSISVTDEDEGRNGQIELGVLSPHDRLFSIDSNGVIRIKGEFTAEHLGEHRIMVFARDGGSPPRESLASIILTISTAENIEIITESPVPSFSYFTFPPETTTQPYSEQTSFESSTESIEPIEDRLAPVFNPPTITVAIDENKADLQIATVSAAYPDGASGSLTYILLEGDENTFKVDSYTGAVRLIRPLDAESEKSLQLVVTTAESASLLINPVLAHNASVTVVVGDANDWIPAFEHSQYTFSVRAETQPGSIIGQTTAFDEDRDEPNNVILYSIIGGGDGIFSINAQNGLITLARPLTGMAGQKISLRVEARDGGEPPQSTTAFVMINIEENDKMITIVDEGKEEEKSGFIRFTKKNFTSSVSESLRPPHLVIVLPIESSQSAPFITCSILSGNFKGAFSVTPNGGNCELRTQMELDREEIERHLLNISVSSSLGLSDSTLVHISVIDANDNTPVFEYDNDLSLLHYYAGVSSEAGPFTRVLTVKANDADIGNSSLVRYSLDALSLHSKYFSISPQGEISTRQSMSQLLHSTKIDKFDLKILACDSPSTGQPLCSRAPATIVVVKDDNRIRIATSGMKPSQLAPHQVDIIRSLRSHSGRCSLFLLDRVIELPPSVDGRIRTNMTWIALDPIARTLCGKEELRPLFEPTSLVVTQGKLRPWFVVDSIQSEADLQRKESSLSNVEWKASSAILILVSLFIALGALLATCGVCYFWTKHKNSQQHSLHHQYPSHAYPPAKLGTIFLPNPSMGDKMYETQMLELPMSEEDLTLKGRQQSGSSGESRERERVNYRSYGRDLKTNYEGDLSIEETMYALNVPTRFDVRSHKGLMTLFFRSLHPVIIPTPDYRY